MIEYCQTNVDDETRRRLRERPEAREVSCLARCGRCYREPFLVIDGDLRRGTHERLLDACPDVVGESGGAADESNRDHREHTSEGER